MKLTRFIALLAVLLFIGFCPAQADDPYHQSRGGGAASPACTAANVLASAPSLTDRQIYCADRVNWNPASLATVTETASTIAFVSGSPATITDSGNGFVTAGFLPGMYLKVGSGADAGTYQLAGVAAGTLTLIAGQTLTNISAGSSYTLTGGAPYTVLYSANGNAGSAVYYAQEDTLGNLYVVPSANSQRQVASPAAPNSTSVYTMQGLAGTITPTRSGSVLIIISGTVIETTGTAAGVGAQWQISYGTSTAPTTNAALTGTQVGAVQKYENPATVTAADVFFPFSTQAVVTGLTVGTAYWIDLAAEAITTASYVGFSNVSISVIEQ